MASKEVMVSAPLVVALHDAIFWGKAEGRARSSGSRPGRGLAATWGLLAALVLSAPRAESAGFEHWVTPARLPVRTSAGSCRSTWHWFSGRIHSCSTTGSPEPLGLGDVWPGALLLVALFALALFALWRWPAAGFVGIACFAVLSASSSVVPVVSEVGAERRMYLPLMALIVLGVCAGELALARFRARALAPWLAGAAALALAASLVRARGRLPHEVALWQSDLRVAPNSRRAHYNLGKAFEREGRTAEAQVERAATVQGELEFYTKVLPLQPDQVRSRVDLGAVYEMAGRTAQAEGLYAEALALDPNEAYALWRMALVLLRARGDAPPDLARAHEFALRAVDMTQRRDAAALEALARVQLAAGDREGGLRSLREALATDPAHQRPRVLARVRETLTALESLPH